MRNSSRPLRRAACWVLPLAMAVGCSSTTPPGAKPATTSTSWFSNPFASKPENPYEQKPGKSEIDNLSLSNKNKTGAELYLHLAKIHEQKGNLQAAKEQYEKGLATEPKNVGLLIAYARMNDRAGQLDEASGLYRRAIAVAPKNATPHNDLGLCLARMDKLPEATVELQKAVDLDAKKPLYRNNLATVLVQQNRVDEAVAQLSQTNTPAVAHYNTAFLLQRRNDLASATRHMTQAAQLDPNLAAAQDWLRENAPQVAQTPSRSPEYTAQAPTQAQYQGGGYGAGPRSTCRSNKRIRRKATPRRR
ncbi:MAG: tetratricopeptide repeat protein [Pirellulales bacterium]